MRARRRTQRLSAAALSAGLAALTLAGCGGRSHPPSAVTTTGGSSQPAVSAGSGAPGAIGATSDGLGPTALSGTTSGEGSSFVAQAGAICTAANQQITALPAGYGTPSGATVLLQARAYERIGTAEVDSLARLAPPAAVAAPWRQFLMLLGVQIRIEADTVLNQQGIPSADTPTLAESPLVAARAAGVSACAQTGLPSATG